MDETSGVSRFYLGFGLAIPRLCLGYVAPKVGRYERIRVRQPQHPPLGARRRPALESLVRDVRGAYTKEGQRRVRQRETSKRGPTEACAAPKGVLYHGSRYGAAAATQREEWRVMTRAGVSRASIASMAAGSNSYKRVRRARRVGVRPRRVEKGRLIQC